MSEQMTYYCKPFVHQTADGWKPGVEYGWRGSEQNATRLVYGITLDNEALAMAFARSLMEDEAAMAKQSIDSALATMRRDLEITDSQ